MQNRTGLRLIDVYVHESFVKNPKLIFYRRIKKKKKYYQTFLAS